MQSTSGGYRVDRLTLIVKAIRAGTLSQEDHFHGLTAQYDWQRAQDWVDLSKEGFYIKYPDAKPKES